MSEVTRDWDAERSERFPRPTTFKIGGETFTVLHGIPPEEYSERAAPFFAMTEETSNEDAVARCDEFIIAFLAEENGAERWRKVRAQRDPAITAREMFDLARWIIEEQTGVPTKMPAFSGNGDETAGANSTESSSSALEASEVSAA